MDYEGSDDSNTETADARPDATDEEAEEGFGDEFDDFEAGTEGDDFGEFDGGFQEQEESLEEAEKTVQPDPLSISPFVSRFNIGNPSHKSDTTHLTAPCIHEQR